MLELKNISVQFGGIKALSDVSFKVEKNTLFSIIGPNGAGKTTLMRAISGLMPVKSGNIDMEGTEVTKTPAHDIVKLGIAHVPEHRRLFPRMSVEDNLRMGSYAPQFRANYNKRLEFVYSLFPRMQERRNQLAGTMSGGEQQMCAIGRALMSDPKILLMDEPSAGLAPVIVQQVFDLIKKIKNEGLTVLIVEQNVKQVLKVVDRAYIIEAGSLKMGGTSSELLGSSEVQKAYLGM